MINQDEKRRADRMAPGLLAFPLGWFRLYLSPAKGQGDIFSYQLELALNEVKWCHFP